jgi:viroplasmin and RNaseH domain-containing protein
MTWYVVYKGKVPGVYDDWEECRRQVHHFSGNSYEGYNTLAEAKTRYANYLARERTREMERSRMTTFLVMMLTAATVFLFYVFLV